MNQRPQVTLGPSLDILSATVSEADLLAHTESSYGLGSNQNIFEGKEEHQFNLATDSTSLVRLESRDSKAVLTLNGAHSQSSHGSPNTQTSQRCHQLNEDCGESQPVTGQLIDCSTTSCSACKSPMACLSSLKLSKTSDGCSIVEGNHSVKTNEGCEFINNQRTSEKLDEDHINESEIINTSTGLKRRSSSFISLISATWRQKVRSRGQSQGESTSSKKAPGSSGRLFYKVYSRSSQKTEHLSALDTEGPDCSNGQLDADHVESFQEPDGYPCDHSPITKHRISHRFWKNAESDENESVGGNPASDGEQDDTVLIRSKTVDSLEMAKKAHFKKAHFKKSEGADLVPSGDIDLPADSFPDRETPSPRKSIESLSRSALIRRIRIRQQLEKIKLLTGSNLGAGEKTGCEPHSTNPFLKKPRQWSPKKSREGSPKKGSVENRWVFFGYEHHRFLSQDCCPSWREEARKISDAATRKRNRLFSEKPKVPKSSKLPEENHSVCSAEHEALPPALPPRKFTLLDQAPSVPEGTKVDEDKAAEEKSQKTINTLIAWLTGSVKSQLLPGARKLESLFKVGGEETDTENEDVDVEQEHELDHEGYHNESVPSPCVNSAFLPSSAVLVSVEVPSHSASHPLECPSATNSAFLPIENSLGEPLSPSFIPKKAKLAGWKKFSQAVKVCFSTTAKTRAQYSALSSTERH